MLDLVGWLEFFAIMSSIIVVPILWMVLRGERSGDVWEGERFEEMSRDEPIDMPPKMLDYGWPVRRFTPVFIWVIRKAWGAERVFWGRKKREKLTDDEKNQRKE